MEKHKVKTIVDDNPDLFDYGAKISESVFCSLFSIEIMNDDVFETTCADKTKQQIKRIIENEELSKLSCFGVVLDIMHDNGKHIFKSGMSYVVALPSENEAIVERYVKKATRATQKAKRLLDNSPYEDHDPVKKTNLKSLVYMMENRV